MSWLLRCFLNNSLPLISLTYVNASTVYPYIPQLFTHSTAALLGHHHLCYVNYYHVYYMV